MAVPRSDRGRRIPLAAVFLLLGLAACAVPTPYQAAVDGYGYTQQQLETDRYRVGFSGNSVTTRATVQDYLLYRAAELTVEQGHDWFTVVNQDLERSTTYYGAGYNNFGWGGAGHSPYPFGFSDYTASPIDSYTAFADIVMADGEKPAGDVNAYDARDVLRQLALQIRRPEEDDASS